jgi:hypothetical protein
MIQGRAAMQIGLIWKQRFQRSYIPATYRVVEVFLNRLVPTFATAEAESEALTNELWEAAMSRSYDSNGLDDSDIAEAVQEAGVEHYFNLKEMEQGILNCCALFLYHLFEQHLMQFHRQELLGWLERNEIRLFTHDEVHRRFEGHGLSVKSFASWAKLEELRHLANMLKHGEGKSSRELTELTPDLFTHPSLIDDGTHLSSRSHRLYTPLLGDEIFVTAAHVRGYAEAIERFWLELSSSDAAEVVRDP